MLYKKISLMKKNILLLYILTCFLSFRSYSQNWAWAKGAGGNQKVESYAIAIDSAGNSYVTGWFEANLEFGSTTLNATVGSNVYASDIFVAKYDRDGNFVWARRAGGTNYDYGNGIATDPSGNVYVTGLFIGTATFGSLSITSTTVDYDVFIAKYDPNGNVLWVNKGGGSVWDVGNAVTTDHMGNCYITGGYRNTATFGTTSFTSAGNYDIFVAKYDTNGNFVWAKSAGGTGDDRGQSISVDASGNSYLTGFFKGTMTVATSTITSAGNSDIFLMKYNAAGTPQWAKRAGGTDADEGNSIKVQPSGNLYVTGYFTDTATFGTTTVNGYGNADIFVGKFDFKGDLIWVKKYGGLQNDKGYGISLDTFSNVFVTGSFWGTGQFDTISLASSNQDDAFVAGINNTGTTKWVLKGGGVNIDVSRGIASNSYGRCYITGFYSGSAMFDTLSISGVNDNDLFVAKIDSTFLYDSIPFVDDTVPIITGGAYELQNSSVLMAYPNPFTEELTLYLESASEMERIEMYDVLGKSVLEQITVSRIQSAAVQKRAVIDGSGLNNGVYFVKVFSGGNVYSARLVLVR